MRGVWIEIHISYPDGPLLTSLPMRGVWIEIAINANTGKAALVTPHAGSVD